MIVQDITDAIEEVAPLNLAASYDNSGLLIGNKKQSVTKALLCIDCTEAVVEEAIELGCELIVSHHPLIFSGVKQIGNESYIERCITLLIKHDIALYASHTPLDCAFGGISYKMGEKIGLQQLKPLTIEGDEQQGYGVIGTLAQPEGSEQFLERIKSTFDVPMLRHTEIHTKEVKKVALCGGSAASLAKEAMKQGADIYFCGDFKYHDFFMAENRIILADIGHFEGEKVALEIFYDIISKKFANFALYKTNINSNPIIYL